MSSFGSSSSSFGSSSSYGSDAERKERQQMEGFQQALLQEQQRAQVQGAINKLTDICFAKCVKKAESSLGSREQSCIQDCAGRYLEVSQFIMQRAMQKRR